ncbi:MAG: formate/nitrite transporter family protein [Propionibacteriaceae bacterium]|nr:formate/nitrite transporter family protein [Propionibacteriaceae bacterium]
MASDTERLFPGKFFISTALEALEAKTAMSKELTVRYLQRAGIAGVLIAIFYGAYFSTVATFAAIQVGGTSLAGVGKLLGALVFGWALVFIYFTKSELLTSNMMVAAIGVYYRRVRWGRALRMLALCLLGNFLGGLLLALLLKASTLASGPVLVEMEHAVGVKLGYLTAGPLGWSDLLVRAILCNLMINVAMLLVYNGFIKDDLTRSLAMITAVFIFAFLGLEHSVANTILFTVVGLKSGIDVALAAGNVGIALVGNFVGGGVLIGLYYAYVNDDSRFRA